MSGARRRRRWALVALLLLACALLSGCRKVVSQTYLERTAKDYLDSTAGVSSYEVDCPQGRTMATDNDFFCTTRVFGRRGTVLIRQLDDYGHVTITTELPFPRAEAEAGVRRFLRQFHDAPADVPVRCPRLVVRKAEEKFACRTPLGRVEVTQVDGVHELDFTLLDAKAATR